jgi:hypothetical protein
MEEDDVQGREGAQPGQGVDALFFWLDDGGLSDWRENFENVRRRARPRYDLGPCAQKWCLLLDLADAVRGMSPA